MANNKQQNKKKRNLLLGILIPVGTLAVASAIAIPLAISCSKSIKVDLTTDSSDVKIKEAKVEKGKDSTITLDIPSTKEINSLEVKVDGKSLTKGTEYTLEGNVIKIKGEAVTGNISIKVTTADKVSVTLTADSSEDVSIKEYDVHQNKKSFVVLNIPDGKEIDVTQLEVKVDTKTLVKDTDYKLEGNKITIEASAINSNKLTIKIIVKSIETVINLSYDSAQKIYKSSDITIKPNSTISFNINVSKDSTSVVAPQIFTIIDNTSTIVPISSLTSVHIDNVAYTEATLSSNKINLGNLTGKVNDGSVIKIMLTTGNTADIIAKAVCNPLELSTCLEMSANKPFKLKEYSQQTSISLEYSTNNNTWTAWDGSEITSSEIKGKQSIYLRGKGNTNLSVIECFVFNPVDSTGDPLQVSLDGNIMTLLDYENPSSVTMAEECFKGLFNNCSSLVSLPKLPATTLSKSCYQNMFNGCTGLKSLPEDLLPANVLTENCYKYMFRGCTSLTQLPEKLLPTTTLANDCYYSMFNGCTGLTQLPEKLLPAKTLTSNCYYSMFYGCTGLTQLPENLLPATTLASNCYYGMFQGCNNESFTTLPAGLLKSATTLGENCYSSMFAMCTGLTTLPDDILPATELKTRCCYQMFNGCSGLKSLPDNLLISPTKLADSCYSNMFIYCTGLSTLPKDLLPATELASNCYEGMFNLCNGLTTLPKDLLPATTLANSCYQDMFKSCYSLNELPSGFLPATELAESCYEGMFNFCYKDDTTGLTTLPSDLLPATTLANNCYKFMFYGCVKLTTTPSLPSTTLEYACYQGMFMNCTGLTSIGLFGQGEKLNDITTDLACYQMFYGCEKLNISLSRGSEANTFIKFGDITCLEAVTEMFYRCRQSALETPEANKSYKYTVE